MRALAVTALIVVATAVAAEERPAFEVHLEPERLGVEDQARLTVTVWESGRARSAPRLGQMENFQVVAGPSTETQFSIVNGVASSSVRFVYILEPLAVGPAMVGPLSVELEEAVFTSRPIAAEVVEGSLRPQTRSMRRSSSLLDPTGDPFAELFDRRPRRATRVVLRQLVPRRELALGENLVVSLALDASEVGVERFEWIAQPSYPGWWAQPVEVPQPASPEAVEVEGARFYRYLLARFVLIPLKSGALEIPAVSARIGVRSGSVFAPMQAVESATSPVQIEVAPRPAPPAGFAGAVGNLSYSARLEPASIRFGESAVLTIELEGDGNLPLVEAPAVWPSCAGCETYPPEEDSRVTIDQHGIHGSRVWRTTVLPREWGDLELAPVVLATFDPKAGVFRRHPLGPLRLTVEAPAPTPGPTPVAELEASTAGALEEAETPPRVRRGSSWTVVAAAALAGLIAGSALAWLAFRRRRPLLPPRRPEQTPAERARELQLVLERWWLDARAGRRGAALQEQFEQLRRELEAVRFAPSRADHSETVAELETRMRRVVRRS